MEALSGRGFTPIDKLAVLSEFSRSMGGYLTQATQEGERWLKEEGLHAGALIRKLRYITQDYLKVD